ncbi:redoxin domain-containing protein [Psychroserpens sp. XS_ASV72]|uniref:redoxin domain-containing protein n=1 Tax=Psychroserpens sp. XS_ASV72 TaxID=3241293 RepID=UPI003516AF62
MKTQIYLIILCIVCLSCKEEQKPEKVKPDGYVITGKAEGLVNGLRAYLKSTDEKGFLKNRDTAIIMNEQFVFEGKTDSIQAWYLDINSLDHSFPLVISNESIDLEINNEDIRNSLIKGTAFNNAIAEYNANSIRLNDSLENISELYRQRLINKEPVTGMTDKISDLKSTISDLPHDFIDKHTNNPYGLVLLNYMIRRNIGDKGKIVASFDALPEELINTNLGKRVSKSIPKIRREYEIIAATHIGKVAPEFSAPSPSGKRISLSDIKGKATLVHFWSSWYDASRRENARLVEIYNKYHDKGLEMIGVSLDGNKGQKNPKSDWKNAIKEDQLIWAQVSNLNYFYDTISKTYSIKSLPASFLLDDKGVIVAKNLTGTSLDQKLEALLGE